jgi:hypothetical protein
MAKELPGAAMAGDTHTLASSEVQPEDSPSGNWGDAKARPVDPVEHVERPGGYTTSYERDFAALPPGEDLLSALEVVETAEDFSIYAEDLLFDFNGNAAAWNNACLHSFLDAVASTVSYLTWEPGQDGTVREPSWRLFAAILHAARFYGTDEFEEWVAELGAHLFDPPVSSQLVQ